MVRYLSVLLSAVLLASTLPAQTFQWKKINAPTAIDREGKTVQADVMRLATTDGRSLIALSQQFGIFISMDRGVTWKWTYHLDTSNPIFDISTTPEGLVGGASRKGFLLSFDHGETWTLRQSAKLGAIDQLVFGSNGSVLARIEGTSYGQFKTHILRRSTDLGITWNTIDTMISARANLARTSNGTLLASTIEPEAVVGVGAFWSSEDNGFTWVRHNIPQYIGYSFAVLVSPKDDVLIASYEDDGIYWSGSDFDHWRTITDPTYHTSIYQFAFYNGCLAYFNFATTLLSCDEGRTWDTISQDVNLYDGIQASNTLYGRSYEGLFRLEHLAGVDEGLSSSLSMSLVRGRIMFDQVVDKLEIFDRLGRCVAHAEHSDAIEFDPDRALGIHFVRIEEQGISEVRKVALP
jgi:hypothetical protein